MIYLTVKLVTLGMATAVIIYEIAVKKRHSSLFLFYCDTPLKVMI